MAAMDDPKLIETLTRMETKLDNFILKSDDHESRIRAIEKKIWAIPGVAVILEALTLYFTYGTKK